MGQQHSSISNMGETCTKKLELIATRTMSLVADSKEMARKAAGDPRVRATGASAVATSCLFGFGGGIVGMAVGGIGGAMVGLPFALFTFGLSIPISALVGASICGCAGSVICGSTGCGAGGLAGFTIFTWRAEIQKSATNASSFITTTMKNAYAAIKFRLVTAKDLVSTKVALIFNFVERNATKFCEKLKRVAKDTHAQVTLASAASGGTVLGALGGGLGLVVGGAIGGAIGVIPALFTFGLSIPIGTIFGGCTGLVVGTSIGGAAGFLGAGTTGYGVYGKRVEIHKAACDVAKFTKDKVSRAGVYIQANLPQSMTLASQSKRQ